MLSFSHKQGDKKFRVIFVAWWLSWCALYGYVLNGYALTAGVIFTDTAITNVLIAGACLLVYNNMRYYLPKQEKYWYILTVGIVLSAICTGLATLALRLLFKENEYYTSLLAASWLIRFVTAFLLIGCMSIMSLLWHVAQEQNETEIRRSAAEQMLKDAELFKLRQQLQPHFLFNSLNSISALTITNAEGAREMIQQLSDFLRSTLRREEIQLITLQEELAHLKLYLDIEKVRFGHRLQISINTGKALSSMLLPALLLQPLVENAIKFGLYNTLEAIEIGITATEKNNVLVITVVNPFDEDCLQAASGTGFGLESVRRRLYLLFGRYDLLETIADKNLFTTKLTIPQNNTTSANESSNY